VAIVTISLAACRSHGDDSASVAPARTAEIAPQATPSSIPSSRPPAQAAPIAKAAESTDATTPAQSVDFDNDFEFGEFDAGVADAAALHSTPMHYAEYVNPRFGFGVDAPTVFRAMEEPINGDGQQWRLGNLAVMTASGMNAIDDEDVICPNSVDVVFRKATKTSCFATGVKDGFIYWQRNVVSRGAIFSLRFQYAAELKAAMDPIVSHVNASWRH
jgi:hypothetical protein